MNTSTSILPVQSESKRSSLILNCFLVCFGILAPVAAAELFLRMTRHQVTSFDDTPFRRSAWSLRPNTTADYVGVPVRINNLSLRGPDTTAAKPSGVFRIIGVGDSITFGYGVRFEETFLEVLRRELAASAPPDRRFEVLNAGIAATGLAYYTHFIEKIAPSLQPDLILICMALNDLDPDLEPEPREPRRRLGISRRWNSFLLLHSYLYNTLYVQSKSLLYRLNIINIRNNEGLGFLAIDPPSEAQTRARRMTAAYLSRIAQFTRTRGQRLAIVVFPLEPQLSTATLRLYAEQLHLQFDAGVLNGQPQSWIRQMGADNSVPVLDLLPAMRQEAGGPLFLRNRSISVDPTHPSPAGHRVAGKAIAQFLRSSAGLLP